MFPDALTARAVLYDNASHEVGRAELTARLRELGFDREIRLAAPALGPLVRDLALPEIAAAVDGLLDISVGDAALAGWRGYDRLRGAAQRTRTGPEENVELLAHDLTHTYRPRLEILVDGQSSGSPGTRARTGGAAAGGDRPRRASRRPRPRRLHRLRLGRHRVGRDDHRAPARHPDRTDGRPPQAGPLAPERPPRPAARSTPVHLNARRPHALSRTRGRPHRTVVTRGRSAGSSRRARRMGDPSGAAISARRPVCSARR